MKHNIWIVYNGNLHSQDFDWHVQKFRQSGEKLNLTVSTIASSRLLASYGPGSLFGDLPAQAPLFVLFWDKDINLAMALEQQGFLLLNSSECIRICDDKALTYFYLQTAGLPIPHTIAAPKVYAETTDFSLYPSVAKELKFPMVMKECFGSFGNEVYLVQNKAQMLEKIKQLKIKPFLFQQYISSSHGRDIRVLVCAGKILGAMLRKNSLDFRSNVAAGGSVSPIALDAQASNLAVAAAAAVGADFAGVDLLFDGNGGYYVCEVNSNMHFRALSLCIHTEIAERILEELLYSYKIKKDRKKS